MMLCHRNGHAQNHRAECGANRQLFVYGLDLMVLGITEPSVCLSLTLYEAAA